MNTDLKRLYFDLRRTFPMLPARVCLQVARQSLALVERLRGPRKAAV